MFKKVGRKNYINSKDFEDMTIREGSQEGSTWYIYPPPVFDGFVDLVKIVLREICIMQWDFKLDCSNLLFYCEGSNLV